MHMLLSLNKFYLYPLLSATFDVQLGNEQLHLLEVSQNFISSLTNLNLVVNCVEMFVFSYIDTDECNPNG